MNPMECDGDAYSSNKCRRVILLEGATDVLV
ncbi:hypothetical protein DP43_5476 [Burkholderia pseudomallei]|nr:hypothetical protein DP43_5476 [Burkholderia pseudomallei]